MSLTVSVAEIINKSNSELLKKHQSWERVELGYIANVLNGYAFNSNNFSRQSGIPLIRIRDISRNTTEVNYDGLYVETYLVQQDDLLVGMDGDFNCALWNGPIGLLNQRVCKIEVEQEFFNKKFLFYVLPNYLKAINEATSSMTVKHLSSKSVEEILLPLAPLPEQARIVAEIEQQFTRLDSAVASLRSAREKFKQYRASLLKAAVAGETTAQWRATHPTGETGAQLLARILHERRARWEAEQLAKLREKGIIPKDNAWKEKYQETQAPDEKNLPPLPEGWCWATVEQVAKVQGGIQKQPSRVPYKNAYPYLRVANVLRGRLDLSIVEKLELFRDELETLRLKSGDLLIVEGNGSKSEIGRSALWNDEIKDCVHQNHIIRVRVNYIMPKYVDFYWNSPEGNQRVMDEAASTTGLYTLSVNKISRLPIPLPPLAEQRRIVAEVEAQISKMAKLEETVDDDLRAAEQERQSILREAFAGRLVPQDSNDESAAVLLERIRIERLARQEGDAQRRKDNAMEMAQHRKKRKRVAPLYDALVEAGGELPPHELYKRSQAQRNGEPTHKHDEHFYGELDVEERDTLIAETRPALDKVLLSALAQDEGDEEGDEEEDAPAQRPTLWDEEEL